MNGADFDRGIDDDLWNDIQEIFGSDRLYNITDEMALSFSFGVKIASGFRFRYQSEIDKKSFSSIKGEKDKVPTIKILSQYDVTLRLDLVTESSSSSNPLQHFNAFYEIPKVQNYSAYFEDGVCFIPIEKNRLLEIKLDFIGIRKLKLKEAIPRIHQIYEEFNDIDIKKFYSENKETVKIRALLIYEKLIISNLFSNTIKSQNAKENNDVKIQHFSPKIVSDFGESLIIVLEKKITSESKTYLVYDKEEPRQLFATYSDGQTFVFRLPKYTLHGPVTAMIEIKCSDQSDSKPIHFIQPTNELRKRKSQYNESNVPIKKPTNYYRPQHLVPESGNLDDNIEFDGPLDSGVGNLPLSDVATLPLFDVHISGNDSCKDSGIHSDDKSLNEIESDSDDDGSSFNESDDESDVIEVEGIRRRRINQIENLEPINFPQTKRAIDSHLEPNRKDQVANKIFSEVARIGHDLAFGKLPSDLFSRIEKQLPVVFTLQDDVGDTPLNNAILKGNVEAAERILKVVCNECKWALDIANTSGHTALILAPACDVPASFITKLLDVGCKLDIVDDLGKSAITYAIEYKNSPALSVLLEHIKRESMEHLLKRSDKVYYSLLQLAVMNMYAEGVEMLLSLVDKYSNYMVDVNEMALMNEDTALHIAVEREVGLDIIKLLLSRPDIDINHKKDNITTALHTALKMKSYDVATLLRAHMAEDINEVMYSEEIQDSVEEMDDEDNTSSSITCDLTCPEVEMMPEQNTDISNITMLTSDMENMSLKGNMKKEVIKIILNGDIVLSVDELSLVIRPGFQTMIKKSNNEDQPTKDITDILERFNCLPNSLGQLVEKLRQINRLDMIQKIADYFHH